MPLHLLGLGPLKPNYPLVCKDVNREVTLRIKTTILLISIQQTNKKNCNLFTPGVGGNGVDEDETPLLLLFC